MEIIQIIKSNQNRKKGLFYIFAILLTIFFLLSIFLLVKHFEKNKRLDEVFYKEKNKSAYSVGVLENNPQPLQDLFLYDITHGINDKYTKSDAYFIINRYLNNEGDIYELYDYIHSHKELAFLNEAEDIYPEIFSKIKEKALPVTFTNDGLYATLAYYEVLDKHGYANIAALGTLSNQYAKLAYFEKKKKELATNLYSNSVIEKNASKAIYFAKKADSNLASFIFENNIQQKDLADTTKLLDISNQIFLKNVTGHDLLIGLTQYAASLRYLEAYGTIIPSTIDVNTMFSVATDFSKHFIPEYLLGISILNASTLNVVNGSSTKDISVALKPIIDTGLSVNKNQGVIEKILKARLEEEKYFTGTTIKNINFDRYGKANIISLAKKAPDFKSWLLLNGWVESDFEVTP